MRLITQNFTIIIAGIVGLIFPLFILLTHKKVKTNINKNNKYRLFDYKQTILIFWILTFLILINHYADNKPTMNFYPNFSIISIGLTVLILAFALFQYTTTKVSVEGAIVVKEKLKNAYYYLPKTDNELKWFLFLSVSAGICEEIMFRLFLFEFLKEIVNLIIALVLTNLIFSITHIGSGKNNLISSFILGLLFSMIYFFTENIWMAILLHISIDINAGILGYRINRTILNDVSSAP